LGCGFASWLCLVVACGDTTEADEDMNRGLDRVFDEAAALETELDAHAAAISTATDTAAVDTAEASHRDVMGRRMTNLDHELADMTTFCRHRQTQERGRTQDMQAATASMRDELERHRTAARPDVTAARMEEERHRGESQSILTRLRDAGSTMRHDAGFYRCQHSNH
jgi:hypothetical protein